MSMITPKPRPRGPNKGGARRYELNRTYANPLPLVFLEPASPRLNSVLGVLGLSLTQISNPHCQGGFDAATRSVWVVKSKDSMNLWRRGFFGKGNLSRSEPSWLSRRMNARKTGENKMTAEEMTAKRRAERKQFKLDRAQAIAAAHAEAEAAFAEGRIITPALSGPSIPSAATWKPSAATGETDTSAPAPQDDTQIEPEESIEDMEHLQLALPEAFFLLWNLDCLTVCHLDTGEPMSLKEIWLAFQHAHHTPPLLTEPSEDLHFDNPFLVNYVVYHHYRSLGWVVKGGIKFCVDYLLYKRGPVFSHAEFAIVVCPVYEDPTDQETSIFDLQNSVPFSWSWLSTINRVNSQVQKTLVLAYVTIPARSRLPPHSPSSPACFANYSVREVTLRRFVPARMRD